MIAEYVLKDFGKILKKHGLQMRRLMLQSDTDCMRVYDRNLEDIQVTIDLYGPYARVTDFSEEELEEEEIVAVSDVVGRMLYVEADNVIFHRRMKRVGREQHDVIAQESLLTTVRENGLTFKVDLTRRIDTGLFLDHMPTRLLVEERSRSSKVLNLFSYTGAFSVYAARGGASTVESVDLSATYSRWAEENLRENGFSGLPYRCITSDARTYLAEAEREGRMYDLIILDPPSFSNSRKMEHDFDVQRDYLTMMAMIYPLLTKDGNLLFSTNLQTFRMERAALVGYEVVEITKEVLAPGFSTKRATVRTWILTKREGRYRYPVILKTGRDRKRDYKVMKTDKDEMKDDVVEDVKEDVVQETTDEIVEDVVVEDDVEDVIEEDLEDDVDDDIEDDIEEDDIEDDIADDIDDDSEDDDIEDDIEDDSQEAEANDVEDDLLILNWEDESIEVATEALPERRPRHRDDERPSYKEHDDRRPPRRDRDDRRSSRGGHDDRKPAYRGRDDRPSFRDRDDRRPSYRDRDDRPSFRDRDDRRPSYRDRDDRPSFRDRDDRRSAYRGRDERPSFRDRDDRRPSYRDRDERPSFRDRDDRRPSYRDRDDRPSFRDRDDRRPSYRGRDDRPSFRDRDDRRPSYRGRDDRPSFRDRDDRRPSYQGRDERPSFRDRDDRRPSYRDRDERPSFRDRDDRRPSYRDRDERPSFRDDRKPSFHDRDERPTDRPKRDRQFSPKPYGYDRQDRGTRRERRPDRDPFMPREDE